MSPLPALLDSFTLSISQSVVLLLILIVIAVGISLFVYRHTVPEITRRRRALLVTLRSMGLATILFLLFEPVLNLLRTETIEPHVGILFDNSKSMTIQDGGIPRSQSMRDFASSRFLEDIAGKGTSVSYLFAHKAFPLQSFTPDSLTFTGGETDISAALQRAHEDLAEKNFRALVLVTDGNVTSGANPIYTAEALGVPVYVVAVGDSSEKKDVLVSRVLVNSIAYVDNTLPVDVTIRSAGFEGGTAEVSLYEGTTLLERKTVTLASGVNEYPVSFSYTPKGDGQKKLTVSIAPMEGEITTRNNQKIFFIKVLKSKMKVVLVAGAPSADVSLFMQLFRQDKNIEITSFIQKPGNTWMNQAPSTSAFLNADCVFLVGYPLRQSGTDVLAMVREALDKKDLPLFLIFSREVDVPKLRSVLDAYLPFEIVQTRSDEAQVFLELQEEGKRNPVTTTGIPEDAWKRLPPVYRTESSFKPRVGAQVLGTMKLNNITFNEPLIIARKLNRSRVFVSTAYGLWRWQLATDVLDGQLPSRFVSNAVRWLTTRDDDKRVRIRPVKEFFDNGEPVEFTAQIYNESYEPIDNASVDVAVKGPNGKLELVLNPKSAGRYTGILDGLSEGDYTFLGTARSNGNQLGTDEGRFSVGELNVEFQMTRMNNVLLRQLAARTGGRYYHVSDTRGLAEAVASSPAFQPVETAIASDVRLWNLIWLLAAAVTFFAIEWYVRKQSGMI